GEASAAASPASSAEVASEQCTPRPRRACHPRLDGVPGRRLPEPAGASVPRPPGRTDENWDPALPNRQVRSPELSPREPNGTSARELATGWREPFLVRPALPAVVFLRTPGRARGTARGPAPAVPRSRYGFGKRSGPRLGYGPLASRTNRPP